MVRPFMSDLADDRDGAHLLVAQDDDPVPLVGPDGGDLACHAIRIGGQLVSCSGGIKGVVIAGRRDVSDPFDEAL